MSDCIASLDVRCALVIIWHLFQLIAFLVGYVSACAWLS